jgi:hypothetical protein
MSRELIESNTEALQESEPRKKYPRHPITMENSPEETMRIMAGFPERAAKFREFLRGLREKNAR